MTEKDSTTPLRNDLMAIAGVAVGEYRLEPETVAETMREMADTVEDSMSLMYMRTDIEVREENEDDD